MTRVAVTRTELAALRSQGIMVPITASTQRVVFVKLPGGTAGVAVELSLSRMRTPRRRIGLVRQPTAVMETHHTERNSVTLSDIYNADNRRTSPVIASLAERTPIPHPLRGVGYADGTHTSRVPVPWNAVPR